MLGRCETAAWQMDRRCDEQSAGSPAQGCTETTELGNSTRAGGKEFPLQRQVKMPHPGQKKTNKKQEWFLKSFASEKMKKRNIKKSKTLLATKPIRADKNPEFQNQNFSVFFCRKCVRFPYNWATARTTILGSTSCQKFEDKTIFFCATPEIFFGFVFLYFCVQVFSTFWIRF